MEKIDSRSAQVHFLFEGLLAGEIQTITPQQREIVVFAMSRAFPGLKSRQKEVAKIQEKHDDFRGYNRQGKQGKKDESGRQTSVLFFALIALWFKRACYVCIGLLLVVLGYSIYQYF